jgi:hypothetical protein
VQLAVAATHASPARRRPPLGEVDRPADKHYLRPRVSIPAVQETICLSMRWHRSGSSSAMPAANAPRLRSLLIYNCGPSSRRARACVREAEAEATTLWNDK